MRRLLAVIVLCVAWIPFTAALYVGGLVVFASTAVDEPPPETSKAEPKADRPDFRAVGDGLADATDAIQAALDAFSGKDATGVVRLPLGTYRITRTLVYKGGFPWGLRFVGEQAGAAPSGSVLTWDGEEGGTVLRLLGGSHVEVSRLAISGGGKASVGVDVAYDHERSVGSCEVTLDRLVLGGVVGPDSACIRIGMRSDGTPDTYQVNHVLVNRCALTGFKAPGTSRYGVVTGRANAKNFAVRDCKVGGFKVGVRHGGSGFMVVDGLEAYSNTESDVEAGTETIELRAGNSEGSARLLRGTTGMNPGTALISAWTWTSSLTLPDDVVIDYSGYLEVVGCHLRNERTPTALPKIRLGVGPGIPCSFESRGNFFLNAKDNIPAINGMMQPLKPPYLRSHGDYGGRPGKLTRLKSAS